MMIYKVTRMPPEELCHYGTKGQKWGKRNYQNEDGTWTSEGQKRYSTDTDGEYGEPGGERDVKVGHESKPKQAKHKKLSKRQIRKEQKRAIEAAKKEQLKSERASRMMDKGMKALNLYLSYESFKEEWL